MNLQQLEYIIAVEQERHFVRAAEKCFVTQATLSMMIKKLEEELEVILFDRSKQPVVPTAIGQQVIAQAKVILQETDRLKSLINEAKGHLSGELRIGIIPTLAPYLLPLFLSSFLEKYPDIKLKINEITTEEIVNRLTSNDLDVGLVATPLHHSAIFEQPLFYEEFVVYVSKDEPSSEKQFLLAKDLDVNRLWLLEEGHCLRSQVINLCELKEQEKATHQLDFAAGSIETLKKIVETNKGITILPMLALNEFSDEQLRQVRYFQQPASVREVGIVTFRLHIKERLIEALKDEILMNIPAEMKQNKAVKIVEL